MVSILKSTIVENIWQNFRDRLESVISVTITNGTIFTIQRYDSSYSDADFSTKSNLPIMVIETPILDINNFTFKKSVVDGTIQVEIYTTSSEAADKFSSSILNNIETYKKELSDVGLKNVIGSLTDTDFVTVGDIRVHVRRLKFNFKFYYIKGSNGY